MKMKASAKEIAKYMAWLAINAEKKRKKRKRKAKHKHHQRQNQAEISAKSGMKKKNTATAKS